MSLGSTKISETTKICSNGIRSKQIWRQAAYSSKNSFARHAAIMPSKVSTRYNMNADRLLFYHRHVTPRKKRKETKTPTACPPHLPTANTYILVHSRVTPRSTNVPRLNTLTCTGRARDQNIPLTQVTPCPNRPSNYSYAYAGYLARGTGLSTNCFETHLKKGQTAKHNKQLEQHCPSVVPHTTRRYSPAPKKHRVQRDREAPNSPIALHT